MIFGPCCASPLAGEPSPRQRCSTAVPCAPRPRAGRGQATTGLGASGAPSCTWRSTGWGTCWALHVTPATADDRAEVGRLAAAVQAATGASVDLAYGDQGYTGERPAAAAREQGIELEVVKLAEAKRGFVLLPRRWVAERTFAWATRFRRLARDYERLPQKTLADLHVVALVCIMLRQAANYVAVHSSL